MEQNDRAIQPLNLWINGQSSTADVLTLDGYSGYNFVDSAGEVHYVLSSYDSATDTKTSIVQGVVQLDYTIVEDWGSDDQPIFEYVAQQLNLVLI
jgi:hypothetical protein